MKKDKTAKAKARQLQDDFFSLVRVLKGHRYDSEIADKAGISRSLYSQMKGGHKPMSLNSMVRIAAVFGMKVELQLRQK